MSEPENLKRLLAIDYGTKRIGLALCDPLMTFAYPYKTISNDNKVWNELLKIIKEQNIAGIILGYPLKENGEPAAITKNVLKFKKILEEKFKVEVTLRDERYSSSVALEQIKESVTKKSRRMDKGLIDRNAASVILQDYLNEK